MSWRKLVQLDVLVAASLSVSAGGVLCLGCGDSERGVSSDWSGAPAIHYIQSDDPSPSKHLRIFAMHHEPDLCSFLQTAREDESFGLDYLGIYLRDVRPGSHVVIPFDGDDPTAFVRLVRAVDSASSRFGLSAQSGTVTVAFDRIDGPIRVTLDVAINRQAALPLMCIPDDSDVDSFAETCTCQREDGSSFECTNADPKESACCVTADPETEPLRATFTATPCAGN